MKKTLFLLLIYFPLLSQDYKIPPDVIRSLIEADPQPTISLTKDGDLGLVLNRDGYQSIDELAKDELRICLLYTSPSPRDKRQSRMPSSA